MSEPDANFEALLDFLRDSHAFDFTAYKRSSLMRRCLKRMQTVGVEDYQEYTSFLRADPDEFEQLFNTILINVTGFWRDKAAWDFLADKILAPMLECRSPIEPVRFWSAGCSSGEEAYTLAILVAEILTRSLGEAQGLEVFRRFVKIYATDVDEEALQQARHGTYPAGVVGPVPEPLRARYFEPSGDRFRFRSDLRRSVIFGRHDLLRDPPISHLDLLVCRNTLMYLTAEAQRRILTRFHMALDDAGTLFLGRAEMLLTHSHLYTPVDLGHRVFAKVARNNVHDRMAILTQAGDAMATNQLDRYGRPREDALGASVNRAGEVLFTATGERDGRERNGHADHQATGGDRV